MTQGLVAQYEEHGTPSSKERKCLPHETIEHNAALRDYFLFVHKNRTDEVLHHLQNGIDVNSTEGPLGWTGKFYLPFLQLLYADTIAALHYAAFQGNVKVAYFTLPSWNISFSVSECSNFSLITHIAFPANYQTC
jgi:hypothetical protein